MKSGGLKDRWLPFGPHSHAVKELKISRNTLLFSFLGAKGYWRHLEMMLTAFFFLFRVKKRIQNPAGSDVTFSKL